MKKWILIILGLAIFLIAGGIFMFMRSMNPAQTGKVHKNTYAAVNRNMVNFFIYSDGKTAIAIDSGTDPKAASAEMKKLGFDPDAVSIVFLTHSDSDHAGGLKAFTKAKVYMLKEEESVVNGRQPRIFFGMKTRNKVDVQFSTLKNGQTVRVGAITVKVVALPGHTPGSAGYLVNRKVFFSGDAFRISSGKLVISPRMMNNDSELAEKTLKDFENSNIKPEIICTSHSGCLLKKGK